MHNHTDTDTDGVATDRVLAALYLPLPLVSAPAFVGNAGVVAKLPRWAEFEG